MNRPIASISLDLDNKWSYLKTHGDESWRQLPSYLHLVVPRVLDFFERRQLAITVFVVGQDAALPDHRESLASIADAGHEIGNHSFHHEPWLHEYTRAQLNAELAASETAILQATGQRPVGFRGPGFSVSDGVIEVLAERGYLYDATLFPTFLGPLARAYYFLRSNLDGRQKAQRKALFGRLRDGFRPLRPFEWNVSIHRPSPLSATPCGAGIDGDARGAPSDPRRTGPFRALPVGPDHPSPRLVEIPVTTMPIFKLPIHLSYLIYLSKFAPWLARQYFRQAMMLCRVLRVEPSLLLHPLDFLGVEDDRDLSFFPGMDLPLARKMEVVTGSIDRLTKAFRPVTLREQAELALGRNLGRRDAALVRTTV